MATTLTRADLEASFPSMTPKVRAAIEGIFTGLTALVEQTNLNVAATTGINNATVVTLSANDAFGNERILAGGNGIVFQDNGPGNTLVIGLTNDLTFNGGYRVVFNLVADTNLSLPPTGTVALTTPPGPYATDAAAAADGVQIGEMYYRTADNLVVIRAT